MSLLAALLAVSDARRFDPAPLREALSHSNPAVRRQGALAAGRIGDVTAVDLLLPALNDSAAVVQAAAAFALGLLKDARAIPALLLSAQGGQIEAVTAIAKIGGDDGARVISDIIASAPAEATAPVVHQALLESWRLGARAPVSQLVRFADAGAPATSWRAIYALARLRSPQGAASLIRGLADPDPQSRSVAARGISNALLDSARIDARAAIEALRPLLGDPDPHIRVNALRALASFRDSSVANVVASLVADRDIGVAVQAETTLGVIRGAVAIQTLRGRLTSPVFAIKRQAVIALAQADSAAGVAAAAAITRDADWRWRSVAAEAFGAARARAARSTAGGPGWPRRSAGAAGVATHRSRDGLVPSRARARAAHPYRPRGAQRRRRSPRPPSHDR